MLTHNTLGVPCEVADRVIFENDDDVKRALATDDRLLILGGCSNVVLPECLNQRVGQIAMRGISAIEVGDDVVVTAAAGESWHGLVRYTLGKGWAGLENLALIPGQVGAAPIQNIGAYGVELARRTEAVRVFDRTRAIERVLSPEECEFSYRSSVFRSHPDRYVVLDLSLRLTCSSQPVLEYPDVQTELSRLGWSQPTPSQVAEVIIRIRRRKLPDYRTWGNVGSFFKNPVVTQAAAEALKQAHPKLVMHAHGAAVKLAAAQLIDLCGWKGRREGAVSVWRRQPLVLVNLGGASARDFLRLGDTIRRSVAERFQVSLEMEPTVVSANGA
ncbi:MAG: UDP-N-acetylmuramate dehydrogenase [Gammaproteobacteria bacterium]|nr:UDP-N-acetylmuramate dehydrogenase [Gammaproteobacteria bacterium]